MNMQQKKRKEARDTGLAATLIVLLAALFREQIILVVPAIIMLLFIMVFPSVYAPLAPLWFGLSRFLGNIVSKIFFSFVFFIIATPMGLIRRIFGSDPMQLKLWKQNKDSVFISRDYTYVSENLEKPF